MAQVPLTVKVPDDRAARIDELSRVAGMSRSQWIRRAIAIADAMQTRELAAVEGASRRDLLESLDAEVASLRAELRPRPVDLLDLPSRTVA